jgi:Flp pilus assembly protein TadB
VADGDPVTAMLAGALTLALTNSGWRRVVVVIGAVGLLCVSPRLALGTAAVCVVVALLRRLSTCRLRRRRNEADLAAVCDLVVIALTGGLGLRPALETAANEIGGAIGLELQQALRLGRIDGLADSLATASGMARRLYRIVASAAASGASLQDSIKRLADDLHAEQAAADLEAVRRLPVAMLFPLTLLILPGFLLLAVAPALLDAFGRLDIAL